jgi:hypothetical protein
VNIMRVLLFYGIQKSMFTLKLLIVVSSEVIAVRIKREKI